MYDSHQRGLGELLFEDHNNLMISVNVYDVGFDMWLELELIGFGAGVGLRGSLASSLTCPGMV